VRDVVARKILFVFGVAAIGSGAAGLFGLANIGARGSGILMGVGAVLNGVAILRYSRHLTPPGGEPKA
jgi:hypothetical protein